MAVYIITDYKGLAFNEYKIGKCQSVDRNDLLRRYHTYMPEARIVLFQPCDDPTSIETAIKHRFANQMVKNNNNHNSEVFRGDISEVGPFITELILSTKLANQSRNLVLNIIQPQIFPQQRLISSQRSLREIITEIVEEFWNQYTGNVPKDKLVNAIVKTWKMVVEIRQDFGEKQINLNDNGYRKVFIKTCLDNMNGLKRYEHMTQVDLEWFDGEN